MLTKIIKGVKSILSCLAAIVLFECLIVVCVFLAGVDAAPFLGYIAAFSLMALWLLCQRRKEGLESFRLTIPVVLFSCLLGIFLQYFTDLFLALLFSLAPRLGGSYIEAMEELGVVEPTGGELLMVVVLAPFVEEMLYRGVCLTLAERGMPFWAANALQAVLFASGHIHLVQIVYAFLWGLLFGYLARGFRSVKPCICIHVALNAAGTFMASGSLWEFLGAVICSGAGALRFWKRIRQEKGFSRPSDARETGKAASRSAPPALAQGQKEGWEHVLALREQVWRLEKNRPYEMFFRRNIHTLQLLLGLAGGIPKMEGDLPDYYIEDLIIGELSYSVNHEGGVIRDGFLCLPGSGPEADRFPAEKVKRELSLLGEEELKSIEENCQEYLAARKRALAEGMAMKAMGEVLEPLFAVKDMKWSSGEAEALGRQAEKIMELAKKAWAILEQYGFILLDPEGVVEQQYFVPVGKRELPYPAIFFQGEGTPELVCRGGMYGSGRLGAY